jgi:hypothetical protein
LYEICDSPINPRFSSRYLQGFISNLKPRSKWWKSSGAWDQVSCKALFLDKRWNITCIEQGHECSASLSLTGNVMQQGAAMGANEEGRWTVVDRRRYCCLQLQAHAQVFPQMSWGGRELKSIACLYLRLTMPVRRPVAIKTHVPHTGAASYASRYTL